MPGPNNLLSEEVIDPLRKLGLIKEGRLQAIRIRDDFRRLRSEIGAVAAIHRLSDQYHLAFETVRNICYSKDGQDPE